MEDPDLCGRPAGCRCVHAEHVPEGAEPQPWAAWVCSLLSPSHSQQGLTQFHSHRRCQKRCCWLMCLDFCSVFRGETAPDPFSITLTWTLFLMATRVTTSEAAPLQTTKRDHVSLSVCYWTTEPFHSLLCPVDAFTCDFFMGSPEPTYVHHSPKCPLELNK